MNIKIGIFGLSALATLFLPAAALPAQAEPEVTDAWTMAGGKGGGEAPLYMTVINHSAKPDALLRVRCPVAWASEPRATDRGEGGLASRAVKSIAIPPDATLTLEPGGFHVALLQLKEPLHEGDTFNCAITFSGGPIEVPVHVRAQAETEHDLK